jgi:hypothetical protein
MTRKILELVGDNIDSSRILFVTKINNRIPRVTKLPDPTFISHSLTSQFDVIIMSVLSHADIRVSSCWATVDTGQSLRPLAAKNVTFFPCFGVNCFGRDIKFTIG